MILVSIAFSQDPTRFGFGGARKSEKISRKAAVCQLATAALHNRQMKPHRISLNPFIQASNGRTVSSTVELAVLGDQWSARAID